MNDRVAISTLTSRNKIEWLKALITSVGENMLAYPLNWYIYSNGSDSKQEEFLKSDWFEEDLYKFNI